MPVGRRGWEMTCPNCNKEISDTAKVCGYCGTRLQVAPAPEAAEPVPPSEPEQTPEPGPEPEDHPEAMPVQQSEPAPAADSGPDPEPDLEPGTGTRPEAAAGPAATARCPHCGGEIHPDTALCPYCKRSVWSAGSIPGGPSAAAVDEVAPPPPAPVPTAGSRVAGGRRPSRKRGRRTLVWLGALVAAAAVIALIVVFAGGDDPPDDTVPPPSAQIVGSWEMTDEDGGINLMVVWPEDPVSGEILVEVYADYVDWCEPPGSFYEDMQAVFDDPYLRADADWYICSDQVAIPTDFHYEWTLDADGDVFRDESGRVWRRSSLDPEDIYPFG